MSNQWKAVSKFTVGKTYRRRLDYREFVCTYAYNNGQAVILKNDKGHEHADHYPNNFEEKQEVIKEIRHLAIGPKGTVMDMTRPSCHHDSPDNFHFDLEVNRVNGKIVSLWLRWFHHTNRVFCG